MGPGGQKLLWMLPLLLMLIIAEAFYLVVVRGKNYAWRESLTSIGVAAGHHIAGLITAGTSLSVLGWIWQHRLMTIPIDNGWNIALLFIGVEFFYYWYHRVSHECRWFWATHAVHHSPQQLNFSAAYRLGWTGVVSGSPIFFAPLIYLGFEPAAVVAMVAINLLYQFWLHTESIRKLGWLEKLFNTPSNHRVHHGANTRYLDSNYGGVLIIFDHLFGTYVEEREDEPCHYGLVHPCASYNPFRVAFNEWIAIGRDLAHSKNLHTALGYLFGPPGWGHDESRTSGAVDLVKH